MRKHLAWYVKDFYHAAKVRNQLMQVKNIDDVKNPLKYYLLNGRRIDRIFN